MRLLPAVITVLLAVAVAYYVYTPMPDGIQEQWKLMLFDASFRTLMHLTTLKAWLGFDHRMILLRQSTKFFSSPSDGLIPGVKVSEVSFSGVPVRVYEPPAGGEGHLRRGLMVFHGGGWTLGDAKMWPHEIVSDQLNTVVVSVDYRLSPEVIFPVPYLDCLTAAKHFLSPEVLAKYAIDPERVGLSGESAGGNLAAAVAQEIAVDDSVSVKFSVQALIYPALQALDFNTPAYVQNRQMPILSKSLMVIFWMQYFGWDLSLTSQFMENNHSSNIPPELRARVDWTVLLPPEHRKSYKPVILEKGSQGAVKEVPGLLDARASPLLAAPEILAKCPRTYILTCEYDVLRDDGLMYVRRLQDAGVTVTSDFYEGGIHGIFSLIQWPFEFDVGKKAVKRYIRWLKDNL